MARERVDCANYVKCGEHLHLRIILKHRCARALAATKWSNKPNQPNRAAADGMKLEIIKYISI